MSLKEVIADKITSEEKFKELISCHYVSQNIWPTRFVTPKTALNSSSYDQIQFTPPWWLKREYMRIHEKAYPEPTEVIKYLNRLRPEFALHVSREDKNYVAYTPDRASGEADRQLRTTLGRYLSKVWPHLPDSIVQDMVSDHTSEVSDEIELLYGQDIVNVYKQVQGPSSCMSKSDWDGTEQHPAEVYDAEGIAMAVLRDGTGRITTRALVYHASETDKRYIRVYTDSKLTKRLQRAGYVAGTWHGAKFKTILHNNQSGAGFGTNAYVFPYLDGNGGAGSNNVSSVACIDGVITGVTADAATKLNNHAGRIVTGVAVQTSGKLNLKNIDSTEFSRTCALTGVKLNILIDNMLTYWDGFQKLDIADSAVLVYNLIKVVYSADYASSLWTSATMPVFTSRSTTYLDTVANRHNQGFYKLDEKYYGVTDWVRYSSDQYVVTDVNAHTVIKVEDAVAVISQGFINDVQTTNMHKSQLDYTWTKVHSDIKGRGMYATEGVEVVKTLSGRKVVFGIHEIVQLWDDTYEFKRNTKGSYMFDQHIYYSKKNVPNLLPGGPVWNKQVEKVFANGVPSSYELVQLATQVMSYALNPVGKALRVANYDWNVLTSTSSAHYCADLSTNPHIVALLSRIAVLEAEQNALDYSIATNLQGAAGSTWAPPPEVPDCNGRTGTAAKLYKYLLEMPKTASTETLDLILDHGWNASDLADNHRLRAEANRYIERYRSQGGKEYVDSLSVLNDAYTKRKAYYRKMMEYIEAHGDELRNSSIESAAEAAWKAFVLQLEADLWTPVWAPVAPQVPVVPVNLEPAPQVEEAPATPPVPMYTTYVSSIGTTTTLTGTYVPVTGTATISIG